MTARRGPGAGCGADGDTAKSPDGGVTDSFSGRDVASITPFPAQPQSSAQEVSAHTHVRLGDDNTLTDQGRTLMEYWRIWLFELGFTSQSFMYLFSILF